MPTERRCEKCGAALAPFGAEALCPRCMLHEAVGLAADASTQAQAATVVVTPVTEKPGDRIGRYKLLQQIGEGGMGVVYMAEQEEPVHRKVALKVIKLGMDTKSVIARFEAERQALALMDHHNIAKVFDVGATDTGRPYFVMELVRGIRITDYCDQNHLSTQQRLDLFTQICKAIQHAHQKGIIHRDIKPSNILVTLHDGVPVPKIIDFGIAKATSDQRLTDKTLFTAFEQFVGTPAYMSPEQAELSGLDIDTRSDIYSLGVLLYELLTGQTPFEAKELLAAGLDAMRRTIRETEPPKPSTRLTMELAAAKGIGRVTPCAPSSGESTSTGGAHGVTRPTSKSEIESASSPRRLQELIKLVRGDLDWIVMKALEKDRARRYESANGLAMDIQRHLANEPVVARPPSAAYRFQKLVRRNKIAVAAMSAVAAALIIGLGVSTWMFIKERQAHQRTLAAEADARKKQAEAEEAREKLQGSEREKHRNLYVAEMHLARSAWEDGQLRTAKELLRHYLPEPGQEDLRGFEWRYLWHLCQGDAVATLTGHKDYVQCLALSPDGRLLATGSGDGTIKLWDAVTRLEIVTLLSSTNEVRSLAFSPDGRTLAGVDFSNTLTLWDALTRRKIGTLETGTPMKATKDDKMVRFFPNGRLLACATVDGAVTLWDVEKKTLVGSLQGGEKLRPAIAISPDSATIAAASGQRDILLWDAATQRRLATLSGHTANVVSLQFSPDGATLASSSADTTIRLWDVVSRRELALLTGHKVWVSSVAFSPDGRRLVSTSVDGLIKIWDVASRAELGILRGHNAWVNQAAFFPDGRMLASVSDDRTIKLWDTSSLTDSPMLKAQAGTAMDFHFLPDGKSLAILAADGTLTFWDIATGRQTGQLAGRFKGFSDSGRIILGESASGEIELWDSLTRQAITTIRDQKGSPSTATFSPDDRFLACADTEGTIRVWEVATGRLQGTLPGTTKFVKALWFPSGAQGSLLAYQRSSEPVSPLPLPSFNKATTLASSEAFRFWDFQLGRETEALPKNVERVRQTYENGFSLSLMHDGHGGVRIESRDSPTNDLGKLSCFLLLPDSKRIVLGGERDITIWDIETGRRVATLEGHSGWVRGLALSADGRILASVANDGQLKLWNLALRKEIMTLPGQISPHTRLLAFAPDGNSIAALSASEDRSVRLFHAPSFKEIEEADARHLRESKQQ